MTRAAVFLFLGLGLVLTSAPLQAQTTGPVPTPPAESAPPAGGAVTPPALASERARRLDELYSRLREAENARQARVLEAQIGMLMSVSGSDTADLLMARAQQAMQQRQADLALSLLDAVLDLQPDFTEAWSRRRRSISLAANMAGRCPTSRTC